MEDKMKIFNRINTFNDLKYAINKFYDIHHIDAHHTVIAEVDDDCFGDTIVVRYFSRDDIEVRCSCKDYLSEVSVVIELGEDNAKVIQAIYNKYDKKMNSKHGTYSIVENPVLNGYLFSLEKIFDLISKYAKEPNLIRR